MRLPLAFHPKLLDALPGYRREQFVRDLTAGITVGVVALPLAMAFAIASGLKPEAGLFTAIVAGFLISLFGGSRVQIGGPAGAFIVIVYGIVERYGVANLIIATAMSGVMLFLLGMFRLGVLVRFIPVAVVIGFTNGIAVLIGLSQLKDIFGLQVDKVPADLFGMVTALWGAASSVNPMAVLVAGLSLAMILAWERMRIGWAQGAGLLARLALLPGTIVALVLAALSAYLLELPVETIESRFGGIPASLPEFALPSFDWSTVRFLLVPASTLAVLGAIESLLCARVADNFTRDRHDPNQELMAQGIANFVTPFLGGMPATGTIARTVTNIKSGATSPVSGIVHAATLLLIVLVAAPLAGSIPLACLSAILLYVAWNMGQWKEFAQLRNFRMPYRVTLLAVFTLTVVLDLTVAVEVGLVVACITFIYRISSLSRCERLTDAQHGELARAGDGVQAHRLYGALFFGAVKLVEDIALQLPRQALVLDLKNLIYVDSTGIDALLDLSRRCADSQVRLVVCGLAHQPREIAQRSGWLAMIPAHDQYPDLAGALASIDPSRQDT
ncbi:SulP family inorganic anion transporter [Comamonadaceae bacterium G21597-S1]|nr:SulP family inorganic anion transporter [Comamonadaceae bacterium G21597-S1]